MVLVHYDNLYEALGQGANLRDYYQPDLPRYVDFCLAQLTALTHFLPQRFAHS